MFLFVATVCLGAIGYLTSSELPPVPKSQTSRNAKEDKFEPHALGMTVPVLTAASSKDYDKFVGRLVAIRGTVSKTKSPQIGGVHVEAPDGIEREKDDCYAVGILAKLTVHPEQVDNRVPNLGAGTFYILYADLRGTRAEAERVPLK